MRSRSGLRVAVSLWVLAYGAAAVDVAVAGPGESVQGFLQVSIADEWDHGTSFRDVELIGVDGKRYFIAAPTEELLHLPTGSPIELTGYVRDEIVYSVDGVRHLEQLRHPLAESAAATNRAAGDRTAVVLMVDFNDGNVGCSESQVDGLMWSGAQSIDGLYREASYGNMGFPADVNNDGQPDIVRVQIDANLEDACDAYGWASAADSAATDSGYDLGPYVHRIYVLPGDVTCGWAGLGNLGCFSTCRSWVATCSLPDVYAHELGHNLGMHHAATDPDNDGAIDCEYCDRSDFMGYGGVGYRHVNGAHKDQMDWFPQDAIDDITGQPDTTYSVEALTNDPSFGNAPQVLKIGKPGTEDSYYITYRERAGYDSNLNNTYAGKVNVHTFAGSGRTKFVAALDDGENFVDEQSGLNVTNLGAVGSTASVLIGSGCAADAPIFTIDPAADNAAPGDTLQFTASLTSGDALGCTNVRYNFEPAVPNGWNASVSPTFVTLGPGESGQTTLTVTVAAAAPDGDFAVGVSVDGSAEVHTGTASAQVGVVGTAPDPVSGLWGLARRGGRSLIGWQSGASNVDHYRIYLSGQLLGVSRDNRFQLRGCTEGCSLEVSAVDRFGRESTRTPLAVSASGGSRPGAGPSR